MRLSTGLAELDDVSLLVQRVAQQDPVEGPFPLWRFHRATLCELGGDSIDHAVRAFQNSVAAKRLGTVGGRAEGYEEGLQKGYVTAVFWHHGIPPEEQKLFWDYFIEAKQDRHLADRVRAIRNDAPD